MYETEIQIHNCPLWNLGSFSPISSVFLTPLSINLKMQANIEFSLCQVLFQMFNTCELKPYNNPIR